ncbi:hypothetical protein BC829DRAFT_418967 [Chytridium lagenaria]|nr:hypothetical protein BC829DRAFT_418967 [Chytridium lagenaria]
MLEREEALRVIEGAMRSTLESDRRDRHALQTYGERFHSIETEMCESLTAETLLKTSFKSHGHFRQFDPEGQEFLSEMMAVSIDRMSSSDGVLITLEQVLSRDPQTHEIHITGKFNIQRKHMTVELETRYGFKHELKFLDLKSAIATETILNFYAEKFSEKPPTLTESLKETPDACTTTRYVDAISAATVPPTYRLTRNSRQVSLVDAFERWIVNVNGGMDRVPGWF